MTNTVKSLVFIVSLFIFLGLYVLAVDVINLFAGSMTGLTALILTAASLMAAYIIMLYSQALVKRWYIKRQLQDANIILKLAMPPFRFKERLITYIFPVLAVFIPLFRGNALSASSIISVVCLIILIIIVEILFYLNSKTMHAYITNKGIAIMGFDTRFELSFPLNYSNVSGFYSFERLDSFLAFPDRVIVYNLFDSSVMTIMCSSEESRQIKALFIANGVPEKKLQGM